MNDPTGQGPAGAGGPQGPPPTEEELQAAFEEQMRRIRVEDVLLQTTVTLVNLGARRLGLATAPGEDTSEERDLDQARLAIEAVRALVPLCPQDQVEPIAQALSQLQMTYAREAQGGAQPGARPGAEAPQRQGDQGQEQPGQSSEDAERAKARSKLWTPPGA